MPLKKGTQFWSFFIKLYDYTAIDEVFLAICPLFYSNLMRKGFRSYPSAGAQNFTSQGKDPCLDLWAKDFTSKIEVKISAFEVKIRAYEVKSCAYEVKIRAYEVKISAYEVKIRACEVKISAYEVKSWAQKSRHGSLHRILR